MHVLDADAIEGPREFPSLRDANVVAVGQRHANQVIPSRLLRWRDVALATVGSELETALILGNPALLGENRGHNVQDPREPCFVDQRIGAASVRRGGLRLPLRWLSDVMVETDRGVGAGGPRASLISF